MSRAQIDALVSDVIRGDDAPAAVRPTPTTRRTRRRHPARWGVLLVPVVLVWLVAGRELGLPFTGSGSMLGGVPDRPTTYADGQYRFLATQPGRPDEPVGYNPCRPIPVEINYANATPDILDLTRATIRQINRASGLHLTYVGASQQYRRNQGVTGRVLISFNDIPHDDVLQDAAGVGGSYSRLAADGTEYYVGGEITLNIAEFNHYPRHAQALVLAHEFGHVLGLDHVTQGGEVMAPGDYAVDDWGHGDLTGLARLGRLPCLAATRIN